MLFMCRLYVCVVVLGVQLGQEGSGPCIIPNLSHLWNYGTYTCMYFAGHVRIDLRKDKSK